MYMRCVVPVRPFLSRKGVEMYWASDNERWVRIATQATGKSTTNVAQRTQVFVSVFQCHSSRVSLPGREGGRGVACAELWFPLTLAPASRHRTVVSVRNPSCSYNCAYVINSRNAISRKASLLTVTVCDSCCGKSKTKEILHRESTTHHHAEVET